MTRLDECILYRGFEHGEILDKMAALIQLYQEDPGKVKGSRHVFYACANGLTELAGAYGFEGNLWHNYLTFLLVNHENAFSTACEIVGLSREVLMLLPEMILKYSKNCMISRWNLLTKSGAEPVETYFVIIRI